MEVALDTNALSAFAEGSDALGAVLMPFRTLAVPVTVLGEYRYGLQASKKKARLEAWLDELLGEVRVLEATARTTMVYARVRSSLRAAGTPIPENDVWIAAAAIEHNLPLVTRDNHFGVVKGLEILAW
ncbi:MAG: type II toxin-antitoxin system VapC family toxin [Vicinamibacteria bacterium]|nr:type II toxin-antitoxin system VapC family toxin [Vicinamibacteria bacterium]